MEIQKITWPAANDWHGKLYSFLQNTMQTFLHRLGQGRFEFSMHCVDALELGPCLGTQEYDRIEVRFIRTH